MGLWFGKALKRAQGPSRAKGQGGRVPDRAEMEIRAKIIVPAVPSTFMVPCQPGRASRAVPSAETPTSVPVCSVPCRASHASMGHVSRPWGLRYGLVAQAKGFCRAIFKQALLSFRPNRAVPCCAVPCRAVPCSIVSPCRASHAGPVRRARIIRAVPCLHVNRAMPAVSCSVSSPFSSRAVPRILLKWPP